MNYFRYIQFKKDVITVAVGSYLRYALSYRDISEILRERGVNVHDSRVYRWVHEYAPFLYQISKKKHKKAYYKWRIDETYIKIKGKWSYLYRAIDAEGHTLDIWLRKQRDNHSAYAFIKRLIKQFGKPQKVITDQAPSTKVAMAKVIKAFKLKPDCHCTSFHDFLYYGRFGVRIVLNMPPFILCQVSLNLCIFVSISIISPQPISKTEHSINL